MTLLAPWQGSQRYVDPDPEYYIRMRRLMSWLTSWFSKNDYEEWKQFADPF